MSENLQPSEVKKTAQSDALNKSIPGKSWIKCRITGVGACPGEVVLPNAHYETLVDTSDAWISKRTGIRSRHILKTGSTLRDIAVQSANEAIIKAGVNPLDIELVIVATSSPDDLFGDAASVASSIGAKNAATFDLTAACSGFVYGIVTASQFLHTGAYKKALVIGADA
jgi:3-oxoacyl-[acyl-carrier-protein] synthase-3